MYLIPNPKSIIEKENICYLPYKGYVSIKDNCNFSNNIYEYGKLLRDEILKNSGIKYDVVKGEIESIISISKDNNMENEMYKIIINTDKIEITGGGDTGVLYGVQTLRQIIMQQTIAIPCMEIVDYPDIKNRGFYHDITRGRVPKLDTLKRLVDKLIFYKMNQLQLNIEHSFLFNGLSEVWRDDTPLTKEEIIELDNYCDTRGVELVPSMATFGHLYKILNTKSYKHLCELEIEDTNNFSFIDRMNHHTIDVTNSESLDFVKNLIKELFPLFRSRKFNICGDETFDLGKGKSKEKADEIGRINLYVDFLSKIINFVYENGYTPMFWGDVILDNPQLIKKLPNDTICLNWGYSPEEKEDSTKTFYELGVNQYSCPGVGAWNHLINLQEASYKNITRMCNYAHKYKAIGILNTDWGDYGHINHPDFSTVGLIFGAEFSWNKEIIPYEEFIKKISILEFSDSSQQILTIIDQLSKQVSFGWDSLVYYKENYEKKEYKKANNRILEQKININTYKEKNKIIDLKVNDLKDCLKHVDESNRKNVFPYFLASDGIKIINSIGKILLQKTEKEKVNETKEMAEKLEIWFYEYKNLWRSVSKEAELYRIEQVIYWYADYLRE